MAISNIYSDLGDVVGPVTKLQSFVSKLGKINDIFVCDIANTFETHVNSLTATEQRSLFALWQGNGQLLIDYITQVNTFAGNQSDKQVKLKYPLSIDTDGNIVVDSTALSLNPGLVLDDISTTDTTETVAFGKCYSGVYDIDIGYSMVGVTSSAKTVDVVIDNADGTAPLPVGRIVLSTSTASLNLKLSKGVLAGQDRVNFIYRGLASGDSLTINSILLSAV